MEYKPKKNIEERARIKEGTINLDGRMLVGNDLFSYVFKKQRERKEKERKYGIEPSPYDCRR
jgi:hypothetical protein